MNLIYLTVIIIWLFSMIMACEIGDKRNSGTKGFLCGFLLGPFGILCAGLLEDRNQCKYCGGYLNGKPEICQHCCSKLS